DRRRAVAGPAAGRSERVNHGNLAYSARASLTTGTAGVGVLPQPKQFLVRDLRLADITGHRPGSRELQPREGAHRIFEHDARMLENLLEFRGGLGRLAQRDVR